MDDAGVEALRDAIRHMHGLEGRWIESVPVHETFEGRTVWEGEVQVFEVEHPKATRCYAWSYATTGAKRRFMAVLGMGPVKSAADAVRAAIAADAQVAKN